jgi:tetratricopeptide (TPR) repeat protein
MDTHSKPPTDTNSASASTDSQTQTPSPKKKRSGIPSWTLGLLILILAGVLVWAGDALIRSRQRLPEPTAQSSLNLQPAQTPARTLDKPSPTSLPAKDTPEPTSTRAPQPPTPDSTDQTVILATEFEIREGSSPASEQVADDLYSALLARAQELDIEGLSLAIAEPSPALPSQENGVDYLLWGYHDARGLTAYVRCITATLHIPRSTQARSLALSTPTQTELCTEDIKPSADYVLGIAAYQRGETEHALALLNSALIAVEGHAAACLPLLVHTHLYLGNLSALASKYEAALAIYDVGLELARTAEDKALFLTNQASIQHQQGNHQAALAASDRALEMDPGQANAYYHRANAYRALGQTENAQRDLDQALALDPTHARAYAGRGLLYHNANAFEEALEDYDRALELDPWATDVYLNRGGTYATLGELDAALQDYDRALQLEPEDADVYYNRGTVYAIQERYTEALQDFGRALEIKPDFAQVYGNRGLVYKARGETEAAIADLERFIELSDNPQWREMIEQHLAELTQGSE